jgi:MFS family permease
VRLEIVVVILCERTGLECAGVMCMSLDGVCLFLWGPILILHNFLLSRYGKFPINVPKTVLPGRIFPPRCNTRPEIAILDKVSRFQSRLKDSFSGLGAVFANPDLRRLELAWINTVLGQWAYFVALSVFAYEEGGAAAVGLVGLIRTIPSAISAPFSSMLSDRYPRQRIMLVANTGRMLVLAASAAALYADAHPGFIFAAAGVMTILGTAIQPAQAALMPTLARTPEELTHANVALGSFESIGLFLGPAIGGFLLAVSSESVVFAAAALISGWAAFLVARITVEDAPEQREVREPQQFLEEMTAGFRTVGAEPGVRLIVGLSAAQMVVAGAFNVLVVAAALDLLDLGEAGVGFLNSAVGVGGIVGTIVALALVGRQRASSDFGIGILLWSIPIALIGIWPESLVAFALLIAVGAGNTLLDVSGPTLLQRMVRDEVLGRVFGAFWSLLILGFGIGMIAAPLLIELAGIRGALIVTGALLPVLTALFWRSLTRIDVGVRPPSEAVELLRSVPIFTPLPESVLEYLGRTLTTVTKDAGEVVFHQGDHGDRYYLVDAGQVEVSVDGNVASTLGRGEGFGEIALLRDVPRTATVRAKTDVTLHALDRDEFLAAVTGDPGSTDAADKVVTSRLSSAGPEVARL